MDEIFFLRLTLGIEVVCTLANQLLQVINKVCVIHLMVGFTIDIDQITGARPGEADIRFLCLSRPIYDTTYYCHVHRRTNIVQTLQDRLEMNDYKVFTAGNGKEGLEKALQEKPDVVLLDVIMPIMDGQRATERIREIESDHATQVSADESSGAHRRYQRTAIIAVTASAFEQERKAILDSGCDDFVTKPFSEATIFDVTARHLNVRYEYQEE